MSRREGSPGAEAKGDSMGTKRNHGEPPAWLAMIAGMAAGGLGWGIRGQYGHETGAMLSGVLVGAALLCVLGGRLGWSSSLRAVAMLAVGVGFGGAETYGQTIGLTQNPEVVGNVRALVWGSAGLFVKGAVWIGIGAAFFGSALGGVAWRRREMAAVLLGMLALWLAGEWLFHRPFDPARGALPPLYFSASHHWYPDQADPKSRVERWGGLLLAWAGLMLWRGVVRRDGLCARLGWAGFVAGGIGFAGGQCIQSAHAWHPESFRRVLGDWDGLINWWNMMEIAFGSIWGAGVGWGLSRWRSRIREPFPEHRATAVLPTSVLLAMQLAALFVWSFRSVPAFDAVADRAVPMGLIPLVLAAGGGWPAALVALPLTAAPILAKTYEALSVNQGVLSASAGMAALVAGPTAVLVTGLPWTWSREGSRATAAALIAAVLAYGWVNFAFVGFPWPWNPPTGRTVSQWIFAADSALLFAIALRAWRGDGHRGGGSGTDATLKAR